MNTDTSTDRPLSRTLSKDLASQLRDRIVQSGLKRGDRFFSHQEISGFAGVSKVTARMATKVLEREGILESRAGQGTYVVRPPATVHSRTLASRRIGIVLSQWDRQDRLAWDYREIMAGMVQELANHPHQFLLLSYQEWLACDNVEAFIERNHIDGLIWTSVGPQEIASVARLDGQRFPQVLLQRRPKGLATSAVLQDEAGCVADMVASATDDELQASLVLCGDSRISPYSERYTVLRTAIEARLGAFPEDRLLRLPEWPYPDWSPLAVGAKLTQLQPRLIIDLIGYTLPLADAAHSIGKRIGPDYRLISTHERRAVEGNVDFPYTYYDFDLASMGAKAYEMLSRRLESPGVTEAVHHIPFRRVDFSPK